MIAGLNGELALCTHGHPAMATAGLGDVLAGVLGALLAQGMSAFDAACLAVVNAVVRAHQGQLQLRSRRGRGTCALLSLPLIPVVGDLDELRVLVLGHAVQVTVGMATSSRRVWVASLPYFKRV